MIVAIDGPSASGKSTVARALATELGVPYLDTGSTYRAVTWAVLGRSGSSRRRRVNSVAGGIRIEIIGPGRVAVDGRDVSQEIRAERVNEAVSAVFGAPCGAGPARRLPACLCARTGRGGRGRDMGAVVLPAAGPEDLPDRASRGTGEAPGRAGPAAA